MEDIKTYLNNTLKEHKIEDSILNLLKKRNQFSYSKAFQYPNSKRLADIMLFNDNNPYTCIEIKANLNNNIQKESGKKLLEYGHSVLLVRFGVLTDGRNVFLYDWWQNNDNQEMEAQSLDQVFDIIYQKKDETIQDANSFWIERSKERFCYVFKDIFPNIKIDITDILVGDKGTIKLKKDIEKALFDAMFPPLNIHELCRFTTLSAIFATIDKKSYRMCATEGMNDIEDGTFLWEKLFGDMDKNEFLSSTRETIFIMSCSAKDTIDDLTMWRLYANDTKGVCVIFNVSEFKEENGFYLRRVQYANTDDDNLVCKLLSLTKYGTLENDDNGKYLPFVFNYWDLWSAFVKSKEYAVEKEIRLAYIPSLSEKEVEKKWMLTHSNSIVSEYVDFDINVFPLRLERIFLGASCPEKETNKNQLKKMIDSLDEFKNKNIEIKLSPISNYRPPIVH